MERMFQSYSDKQPPLKMLMTQSTCYKKEKRKNNPIKGILIHSVGTWGAEYLKRYCQPDDNAKDKQYWLNLLGKNTNGNDWNHVYREAGVNAWIGLTADGKMTSLQVMEWDHRPWGCGSAYSGGPSCNDGWIQWENCEPPQGTGAHSKEYFKAQYEENVQLAAYLCKKYNLDPQGTTTHKSGKKCPVILCHWDSYNLKLGGGHVDVYHYWGQFMNTANKNDPFKSALMQQFRADVAKAMGQQPQPTPTPTEEIYRVRKTWEDKDSQKGAFKDYDKAKACADANPGYSVFNSKGVALYPVPKTTKYDGVDYTLVYDPDFYYNRYPDLQRAFGKDWNKLIQHFVNYGMKEGRQAKDSFNVWTYKTLYDDLQKAYGDDLKKYFEHYMKYGNKEGRYGSESYFNLVYDADYYVGKYADLKKAFGTDKNKLLRHFVYYGMKEGRQAKDSFNVQNYKANYQDLRKAFGDDLKKYYIHYIEYGYKEHREAKNKIR